MKLFATTIALAIFFCSATASAQDDFKPLFDGKTLDGWSAAKDGDDFTVNEAEQAIHVYAGQEAKSKQQNNCLVSDAQYSHYILKLEYKWGEKRFAPRNDWDRDAGLLYHIHGDLKKVWPFSLEMQIGESPGDKPFARGKKGRFHTGDLFVLGRHLRTDTAVEGKKTYKKGAELKTGGGVETSLGVEKPKGEWNQIEIHVHGSDKAVYMLNGEEVLVTTNFTQKNEAGELKPLNKGHIGLQAEWAEIMYRNILIKELPSE